MHPSTIVPKEKWFTCFDRAFHEIQRMRKQFFISNLHTISSQRASVFDRLFANLAKAWIHCRIIYVSCLAVKYAARTKVLVEIRVFRIIGIFRFFFRIKMVKIAEKFIESMYGRQVFIAVAQMVFSNLRCCVAKRLEQFGNSRILILDTLLSTW